MSTKNYMKIKDLPESLRPYEKCEKYGAASLSDAELLSVIIKSGTAGERSVDLAARILKCNNNAGLLNIQYMTMEELQKFDGIGRVKAIQLKCICELSRRITLLTKQHGNTLKTPEDVSDFYMEKLRYLEREQLMLIMLDSKSRLIKDMIISKGTFNSTVVSAREIYCEALRNGAACIILIHNHPSGDPTPSNNDMYVTANIKEAGELMEVPLVDHIIIGDNCFFSMKDEGYL